MLLWNFLQILKCINSAAILEFYMYLMYVEISSTHTQRAWISKTTAAPTARRLGCNIVHGIIHNRKSKSARCLWTGCLLSSRMFPRVFLPVFLELLCPVFSIHNWLTLLSFIFSRFQFGCRGLEFTSSRHSCGNGNILIPGGGLQYETDEDARRKFWI